MRAREQALAAGLKHVYTGNVHDRAGQSTYCSACSALLIERDWYRIGAWNLGSDGRCQACGHTLAGRFSGRAGNWGVKRVRLPIHERT
jgi:pyruvate formate lyase activating enzyme